eukprot:1196246-Prorocentrum_minimum.AAC.3
MDRQGGWGSCVGKDNQPTRSKHIRTKRNTAVAHTHRRHTADRAADPMPNAQTDACSSGPPSQRNKGCFRTLNQTFFS